jgi:hypothetical protein
MEESDMNDNEYSNEMKNIVEFEKTANDMKKEVKRLYLNSGFTQVLILLTIITFLLTSSILWWDIYKTIFRQY